MNAAIIPSDLEPGTDEGERISRHQTILQLVNAFNESASDIRRAAEFLESATSRLDTAFANDETTDKVQVRTRYGRAVEFDPQEAITRLRLEIWSHLVDRLEVRRFLSVRRATELHQMLDDKSEEKFPDITLENVLAFAQGLRSQVPQMLEEAVQEVFSWLRPPRSEYKTNTELEVGRRAILGYTVEWGWLGRGGKDEYGYRVSYGREQQIRALENVFSALDGRGSVTETYNSKLADAIRASGASGKGETEYFRFKCYRNRNLHLEFKRLDLLERFNAIAGGMRLRPKADE